MDSSVALILKIQPFVIALALGLLIGIERERSHPVGLQPLGSRTFVLFSLLGAIVAGIKLPLVSLAISLFVGSIIIAGYFLSSHKSETKSDIGFTTEVAGVITYALGFLAYTDPFLTLIIGLIVLVVLMSRTKLHSFSREKLKSEELQATVIILVLAIGILPFLPDKAIGPLAIFNPQRFGLLVLVIALLQFGGYVAMRAFGTKKGLLASGFLSGLVSSTAATATLSQQVKKEGVPDLTASCAIVLSTVAMFAKVLIIIFIVSPDLLYTSALPMLLTGIIMGGLALAISNGKNLDGFPIPKNPLALGSAIKLAILLFLMLLIVTLAQHALGIIGTQFVVFLGGLFAMQGVALAIATLYHSNQISPADALHSLSIAILASFIAKYAIIWGMTREKFAVLSSALLAAMLVMYVLFWVLATKIQL